MKTILITGANGQLGSAINKIHSNYSKYNFIFTDREELDITSQEAVSCLLDKHNVFAIVNCAAYTAVDRAESDAELAGKLNSLAPLYLSIEAAKRNIHLVHISTDYVFSGKKNTPLSPLDTDKNPVSVYGKTKLEGEKNVIFNAYSYIIIRTAWLYSETGNNFAKTMLQLGAEKESLNVVYDQIGSPTFATDLALAIMKAVDKFSEPQKQILHYTNEGVCSWYDFAKKVMEIGGRNCKVNPILTSQYPTPAQRPAYSVLDKQPLKDFLQIEIPHWEDSLKECIKLLL
jgi:dTDP-4-dehydrorhamnose reductase